MPGDAARRPLVAVTPGDPAGIGPEIACLALLGPDAPALYAACRPLVLADPRILARAHAACVGAGRLRAGEGTCSAGEPPPFRVVEAPAAGGYEAGRVDVLPAGACDPADAPWGRVSAAAGRAAAGALRRACDLALAAGVDALATGPIHKVSLRAAGVPHIGHTEMLAEWTGSGRPETVFRVPRPGGAPPWFIFFLTRHVPLLAAITGLTAAGAEAGILRAAEALERLTRGAGGRGAGGRGAGGRGAATRLAVAALNPHAGEDGLLGTEDRDILAPAVKRARASPAWAAGVAVEGPVPADAVFHLAASGRCDGVLALYHDQGHIAAKTADFYGTVSLTLGLPFLRTSVDHGTAFDIAGTGRADPRSLVEAIRAAAEYA